LERHLEKLNLCLPCAALAEIDVEFARISESAKDRLRTVCKERRNRRGVIGRGARRGVGHSRRIPDRTPTVPRPEKEEDARAPRSRSERGV